MPKTIKTRHQRQSSASSASSNGGRVHVTRSRSGSHGSQAASAAWSTDDDQILASARASGMNWQPIAARYFPNKTANACRKRHERLMERRYVDEWGQEMMEDLAIAYFDCRQQIWSVLADRLNARWTLVEAKVMEKGIKNLQNIARASQRKRERGLLPQSASAGLAHDQNNQDDEPTSASPSDTDFVLNRLGAHSLGPEMEDQRQWPGYVAMPPAPEQQHYQTAAQPRGSELPLYVPPPGASTVRLPQTGAVKTRTTTIRPSSTSPRERCSIKALLSPEV